MQTCEHCGKPATNRFCSSACVGRAATRYPLRNCFYCTALFKPRGRRGKYCGVKCQALARIRTNFDSCIQCGKTLKRDQDKFCSRECGYRSRKFAHPCPQCGKEVGTSRKQYCSWECKAAAQRKERRGCTQCGARISRGSKGLCVNCFKPKAPKQQLYTPEYLARVRKLAAEGLTLKHAALTLGITKGQVHGLSRRYDIKFVRTRVIRDKIIAIRRTKSKSMVDSHPYNRTTFRRKPTPRGVGIPLLLREVWQWGFTLGVPLSQRGNVEAVSRAMKREDPTHPGFRIAA